MGKPGDKQMALNNQNIKKLARELYIARLTGQYTVRGFHEGLYKQCLEEARKLLEAEE